MCIYNFEQNHEDLNVMNICAILEVDHEIDAFEAADTEDACLAVLAVPADKRSIERVGLYWREVWHIYLNTYESMYSQSVHKLEP